MHTPEDDSEFVGKEPCPGCGSRDNLARYSDGHAYCFGHGAAEYYEKGDGETIEQDYPGRQVPEKERQASSL